MGGAIFLDSASAFGVDQVRKKGAIELDSNIKIVEITIKIVSTKLSIFLFPKPWKSYMLFLRL